MTANKTMADLAGWTTIMDSHTGSGVLLSLQTLLDFLCWF